MQALEVRSAATRLTYPDISHPARFSAVLEKAREVSLSGTADLAYWRGRLAGECLIPTELEGRARVLIGAIDSKFLGLCFRELCIAVAAAGDVAGVRRDGLFFLQAFNSSRLFSFVERTVFSTPYEAATVRMESGPLASLEVARGGSTAFHARMSGDTLENRQPTRVGHELWEGPIFLPGARWFFASMGGETRTYLFDPARDELTLSPAGAPSVIRELVESGFAPAEWRLRADARHARTRTYKRGG